MTTHDTAKLTLAQAVAIARKAGDDAHRLRTESCDTDELTLETIAEMRTENARLKAENTVLRDALNWSLKAGGWELWYYDWDIPETIRGGSIGNHAEIDEEALERAVAAIIEGKEVTS